MKAVQRSPLNHEPEADTETAEPRRSTLRPTRNGLAQSRPEIPAPPIVPRDLAPPAELAGETPLLVPMHSRAYGLMAAVALAAAIVALLLGFLRMAAARPA